MKTLALFLALSATLIAALTEFPDEVAGKIFVADVNGKALIHTEGKLRDLKRHDLYVAKDTIIETQEKTTNALVWSNGSGLYFEENTRLEIKEFKQEPFTPNYENFGDEPSVSNTSAHLVHGVLGICTNRLTPNTNMVYRTSHASIRIKGKKVVIEAKPTETRVSLLEGEVTVIANASKQNVVLEPGQQVVVREDGTLKIEDLEPNKYQACIDKISPACNARKTAFFQMTDFAAGADAEIEAIPVVPAHVAPQVTVSAAFIPRP